MIKLSVKESFCQLYLPNVRKFLKFGDEFTRDCKN